MMFFCLGSMTLITWLYVKPALMHDFDNPELNKAPAIYRVTVYYYAEDLGSKIILKPLNIAYTAGLVGALYVLLRVCSIAYRQTLIKGADQ